MSDRIFSNRSSLFFHCLVTLVLPRGAHSPFARILEYSNAISWVRLILASVIRRKGLSCPMRLYMERELECTGNRNESGYGIRRLYLSAHRRHSSHLVERYYSRYRHADWDLSIPCETKRSDESEQKNGKHELFNIFEVNLMGKDCR